MNDLVDLPSGTGLGELKVDRILTVPNLLTTLRLLCIPLFVYLLLYRESRGWAAFLLGVLASTDWIDGYVARRFNQGSNFGKMYDPAVDRLMMVVAIVAIIIDGAVPLLYAWIVVVREVLVSLWVVVITALGAKRMDVTRWGKIGSFANMCAVPWFLFANEPSFSPAVREAWNIAAWCAAVPGVILSVAAAIQYFLLGSQALREGRAAAVA